MNENILEVLTAYFQAKNEQIMYKIIYYDIDFVKTKSNSRAFWCFAQLGGCLFVTREGKSSGCQKGAGTVPSPAPLLSMAIILLRGILFVKRPFPQFVEITKTPFASMKLIPHSTNFHKSGSAAVVQRISNRINTAQPYSP